MTALRQLEKTCALLRVPTKVTNVKQDSPESQKKKSVNVRLKKKETEKKTRQKASEENREWNGK